MHHTLLPTARAHLNFTLSWALRFIDAQLGLCALDLAGIFKDTVQDLLLEVKLLNQNLLYSKYSQNSIGSLRPELPAR